MTIFQKAANAIRNWKTPTWLKVLLQQLNDLIFALLKQVGQDYINYLRTKILEASSFPEWTNQQRFDYVFKQAKIGFNQFAITLKDSEINLIIEFLFSQLKKSGAIN